MSKREERAALAARVQVWEPAAQEEFHKLYYGAVYAWLRRRLPLQVWALDLTGKVMDELFRSIGNFDPERYELDAWVLGVARNKCLEFLRTQSRRPDCVTDPEVLERLDSGVSVESDYVLTRLREAVEQLPAELGSAIRGHLEGRTNCEMGQEFGVTERAIRDRLNRAKRALKMGLGPVRAILECRIGPFSAIYT